MEPILYSTLSIPTSILSSSLPCRTFLSQLILHNDLEALLNAYYTNTLVVLYKTINSVDDEDNNLVKNGISDGP